MSSATEHRGEARQGLKVGCPEEAAWRQGWISAESWLSMQDNYDLWQARQCLDLSGLTPMELTPA